jgi:aryl-alcohol dehydrogenase-like predicted oxidoreductase
MEWGELAVRFAAFAPGVSCAVVGTTSLGHLREAAAHVAKGALTGDVKARIAGRYEAVGLGWAGRV